MFLGLQGVTWVNERGGAKEQQRLAARGVQKKKRGGVSKRNPATGWYINKEKLQERTGDKVEHQGDDAPIWKIGQVKQSLQEKK